jgi:hypothetical protein
MGESKATRILAEWWLPASGWPVRLEIVRDTDGWDAPCLNHNPVPLPDSEVIEEDERYIDDVIYPQADEVIRRYFGNRKVYCAGSAEAKGGSDYRGKVTVRKAGQKLHREVLQLRTQLEGVKP